MSRRTKAKMMWTLTVLRNGGQGPVEELEEAEFRFGRRGEELEEAPLRRLPAGVVSLIQSTNIEQEAMETGFTLEMRFTRGEGMHWKEYVMLAGNESWESMKRTPRSVYACSDLEGAVEFVDVENPCSFYNQLPERIWIRATPISMPIVAWAMTNGIYSCPKGDQRTLHQWCDMSSVRPVEQIKALVLPGPPLEDYTFLS